MGDTRLRFVPGRRRLLEPGCGEIRSSGSCIIAFFCTSLRFQHSRAGGPRSRLSCSAAQLRPRAAGRLSTGSIDSVWQECGGSAHTRGVAPRFWLASTECEFWHCWPAEGYTAMRWASAWEGAGMPRQSPRIHPFQIGGLVAWQRRNERHLAIQHRARSSTAGVEQHLLRLTEREFWHCRNLMAVRWARVPWSRECLVQRQGWRELWVTENSSTLWAECEPVRMCFLCMRGLG